MNKHDEMYVIFAYVMPYERFEYYCTALGATFVGRWSHLDESLG
jgi:hypothetical protein